MSTMSDRDIARQEVDAFIASAGEEELRRIVDAIQARRRTIVDQRALDVRAGAIVEVVDIRPKALEGLTGTVVGYGVSDRRADVALDERSRRIASTYVTVKRRTYRDPQGRIILANVPTGCLREISL